MLIDGAWVDSLSGAALTGENPAKRVPIADIPRGDAADVDRAVRAAAKAFPGWSQTPPRQRGRLLVRIDRRLAREEIFGPVPVAIPWRDEADAVRMANDSHYGLAGYIWTRDIGSALRSAHVIESGWVQVNQGLGQQPGHSYGGYKQRGIGREFSLEGMLDSFTQRRNVTVNLNLPPRGGRGRRSGVLQNPPHRCLRPVARSARIAMFNDI
jgi:acyl-CoA reductase-like NAD-dependent aldehyde dehydrogenase